MHIFDSIQLLQRPLPQLVHRLVQRLVKNYFNNKQKRQTRRKSWTRCSSCPNRLKLSSSSSPAFEADDLNKNCVQDRKIFKFDGLRAKLVKKFLVEPHGLFLGAVKGKIFQAHKTVLLLLDCVVVVDELFSALALVDSLLINGKKLSKVGKN